MKKKSFIMLVCMLMVVTSVAFGTIAYLTDQTTVINRFTVGDVDIRVDETDVDEKGNPIPSDPNDPNSPPARTEAGNDYHLTPGSVHTKDPVMTILKGSEEAYVRMLVTINNYADLKQIVSDLHTAYGLYPNGFLPEEFVGEWDSTSWPCHSMSVANDILTLEFRYFMPVSAPNADVVLPALFKTVNVPAQITKEQLKKISDLEITVVGQAIQTATFLDADQAWTAFGIQTNAPATAADALAAITPDVP